MKKMNRIGCFCSWRVGGLVSLLLWMIVPLASWGQTSGPELTWKDKNKGDTEIILCNIEGKNFSLSGLKLEKGGANFKEGTYKLIFGDNEDPKEHLSSNFQERHEYKNPGEYWLVFSVEGIDGKTYSNTYKVKAMGRPTTGLKPATTDVKCVGTEVYYLVEGTDVNTNGTTYTINYDDGIEDVMTNEELKNAQGKFKHTFSKSYCDGNHGGSSREHFEVTLTAKNECFSTTMKYEELVAQPIEAKFTFSHLNDEYVCTFEPLKLINQTQGGAGVDCSPTDIEYEWDFGNGDKSYEYQPNITYTEAKKEGYTIRLIASNGISCARDTAYEHVIVMKRVEAVIEPTEKRICEGGSVAFKNYSTGDGTLMYWWSVEKEDGTSADIEYLGSTDVISKQPEIKFNRYGNYKVSMTVDNGCSLDVAVAEIKVVKSPEVYLPLGDVICSEEDGTKTLNFQYRGVGYAWNGNKESDVKAKWTIQPTEGNGKVEYLNGTSETSLYPEVKLAGSATYSFRVEVEPVKVDGVACSEPSVAEKKVRVPSMKIDLAFDPEPSEKPVKACFNDTLKFTNNSVGEDLQCWWELEPIGEYRNNVLYSVLDKREAKLVFDYGEFILTGRMAIAGACSVELSRSYRIQIGHRPEIVHSELDRLGPLCPGRVVDVNKYMIVNYHHHNNEDKALWTFTPELPADAWLDGSSSQSARPVIQFTTPKMTYHYKIEMPRDHLVPGCEDPKAMYELEGEIVIRNNQLSSEITVSQDWVCEGKGLGFFNEGKDPQSGGLDASLNYEWYAIRENGERTSDCVFEEPGGTTGKLASVSFLHYGLYGIVGKTISPCAEAYDTVWITVKKDPLIDFGGERWDVCPGEVKMAEWTTIDWYNNDASQSVSWLVKKEKDGQEFWKGENPGDGDMPVIPVEEPGDYTVSVSVPGAGCSKTTVQEQYTLHVIDTTIHGMETIQPKGYGLPRGLCVGEDLVFENETWAERDQELRWYWTVEGTEGGYGFDGTDAVTSSLKTPTLRFNTPGDYMVHLTIEEGCNTREWTYPLRVRGVPVLNLADKSGCESAFRFVGADEIKEPALDLQNNELLAANWTVEVVHGGGSYDLEGGSMALYPTLAFSPAESSGYCLFRVKVEYKNHCPDVTEASFQVRIDEQVKIEPLVDEDICELVEARRLQVATPDTGVWSLMDETLGTGILEKRADGYYFNPAFSAYEDKEVGLRYTIRNGACVTTDEMTMRVHALPFVDGGRDLQMCYNHEPLPLVGRDSIKGGKWQENRGIWKWGNADLQYEFDIKKWNVTPGDYELTYEYTYVYEAYNWKCPNTDKVKLTVQALPDKRFTVLDTLCVGGAYPFVPADTINHSFEWHFDFLREPDRKEESDGASIRHAYGRHGLYTVKCMASKPYPYHESVLVCRDTSEKTVIVLREPPAAYFDVDTTSGCAPLNIEITTDARRYDTLTFADFTYTWDFGNGEGYSTRQLEEELVKTYQSATWDTTYFLSLAVGNRCRTFRHDTAVTVLSVPKVGMSLGQDWECSPVEAFVKNTTTGNNCTFTWSIYNDRNADTIRIPHVWNLDYHLETDSVATVYYIRLHAENVCATDDSTVSLKVLPRTLEAHFSTLDDRYACEREEIYFRNNSTDTASNILVTQWNFGDGFTSEHWEERHAYDKEGTYDVSLWIHNGCGWAADTQQVYINPLPKLSIFSQDTLCEEDEFHFSFEADMDLSLYEWRLQDTLVKRDSFDYVFEGYGEFPVTLIGTSMTFTRCQDSVIKTVVVNNKPIMTILPLDTAVCSPLNYVPFVEGEHETLLWDYGDGTELTSAPEHVYENRGDSAYRYVVRAFVTTDKGCSSEYERGVTVYNRPTALLHKEVASGRPQRVTFLNLSEGANAGHWLLPLSGEVYSVDDQTEEFMENGLYPVTLIASNRYGCSDTITLEHEVSMHGLYFPNTFIPHSLNAKINLFNGVGMGLQSYHLEILDQYGNVLWSTDALEDGKPVGGWDGTNRKGERMPQGVYIWRAKAIFGSDDVWTGDNNDSGIPEYTQGTVLLLRE